MTGQVAGGAGVSLNVSTNCVDIKSGLYDTSGADTANNFPVQANGGLALTTGTFTTSKATYKVTPDSQDPVTGYVPSYTVKIFSLVPGEPGGTDSFTMFYGPGTDANTGTFTPATAPFTVNITNLVNNGPAATTAIASTSLTQNHAATSFTPVVGSGGAAPLSYSVAPPLPTGLSMSSTTGAITGTPTVTLATTSFTVTVTDANSATATANFSLTVNPPVTATRAFSSVTLTQNHAMAIPIAPVTGSGGTSPFTFGVSPGLPAGLSFNTSTGTISGTPTVTLATSTFTVTITDANNATASNTFQLTVNPAVTATQSVAATTLTQNHAATPFTPVTGGGGTAPLGYGVSPALPTGLSFNTSTGAITGTPTVTHATSTFTVTVTDVVGATASNTFQLTVNAAVTATQAVPSTTLTVGHAATTFTPVTGAGGTGALTFGVAPTLPAGLSFDTTSGAITGTPTVTLATTTFTVTVTDTLGASATNTFSLTVNGPVTATQAIASVTLTQNHAVTSFTPVTGSGGTPPLTFGVSPALPAGLSFNTATGAITGTPTVTHATSTFTVTVTDANSATASNTFSLTINAAVTATQAVPSTTLTANHAATTFTPVTGAGGTAPLSFGVAPSLPAGLSFNTANGAVSGTPTVALAVTTFTVTVTDANGATATNTFSLTVNGAVTATTAVPSTALIINQPATPFTPVTGSGGTAPLTFGVAPTLPAGLSFNTATGAITGTPTVMLATTTFTVTVTDANSATATANFNLSVGLTPTSVGLTSSHNPAGFAQPITFTATVTGSGGPPTGTVTFNDGSTALGAVALAAGVATFTTSSLTAGSHTITASYGGSVTFAASTSPAVTQVVNSAVSATTAIASTTLVPNQAATPFTPVTGSGGTGALTFSITPSLPAGLSFNTANGAISGTPTATLAATTFTVTVTDTLNASASATFSLSVGRIVTTVALTSSQNPSSSGQPVTFTATVTAGSGGTPAGSVTFNDGGTAIGTVALSGGIAAFTTSTLAVGSHTITAAYGGSATFNASTSPALTQTVNVPADSVKLRALQLNVTKMVAQGSGQAISGAIDSAITEGFSDGGTFVTPSASGLRFNFAADDQDDQDGPGSGGSASGPGGNSYSSDRASGARSARGRAGGSRIDDAFAAIDGQMPKKAPPKFHEEKNWLYWVDVRGTGIDRWGPMVAVGNGGTQANLFGSQVNALTGLTYKVGPNFLVGVLGGYETFNYTEQDINGKLTGEGWTVGSYLGWKIVPTLRYDVAVAYSGIGYNGTAGTAQGNFNGQRWLVQTGLTGTYNAAGFVIEPSARVYALWERENAYVDSLGTQQSQHDFATGRASSGVKVAYPVPWINEVLLVPYLGAYGDYYFTQDDAAAIVAGGGIPLASMPLLQGWSARVTSGIGARFASGASVGVGAEYGGLGSSTRIWTVRARGAVPFTAQ